MKESYYFQHDYDPIGDPKISALLNLYHAEGYGVYWRIVEMLHADEQHSLPLKMYIYDAIASTLHISADRAQEIVSACIEKLELFYVENGRFFSARVNRNIDKRAEISEKRRLSAKQRWATNANAMQTNANAMQTNAKKRKEKKRKIEYTGQVQEVLQHLNEVSGKSFRSDIGGYISGRLAEGYTVDDCKRVIDVKSRDPHFRKENSKFLNQETLFRPGNFEKYVNEVPRSAKNGVVFADMPIDEIKHLINKHWRNAGYDLDWHIDRILEKLQEYYDRGGFSI